jgi:hypothetical protein
MPFCPRCRYEYRPEILSCPECGEALVDSLPEEVPAAEYQDWIPIARLTSQQLADMVVEGLQAKEIPAVVMSGVGYFGVSGTQGVSSFSPVGGGYTILVPREFAADADEEGAVILGEVWEKSKVIQIEE